jgi:hypothetical protein
MHLFAAEDAFDIDRAAARTIAPPLFSVLAIRQMPSKNSEHEPTVKRVTHSTHEAFARVTSY